MKVTRLAEDWEDFYDDNPVSEEEEKIGDALLALLTELANPSTTEVDEEYTSELSLETHFNKHCIADDTNKRSTRTNVYYDFTNLDRYRNYENQISTEVLNTVNRIQSVYDTDKIIPAMRKLFEGNQSLLFEFCCGIRGNNQYISLGLHAFSTYVTTNYGLGNTIDIVILNRRNKTITMYPVDANYLQNKLGNIIADRSTLGAGININH